MPLSVCERLGIGPGTNRNQVDQINTLMFAAREFLEVSNFLHTLATPSRWSRSPYRDPAADRPAAAGSQTQHPRERTVVMSCSEVHERGASR